MRNRRFVSLGSVFGMAVFFVCLISSHATAKWLSENVDVGASFTNLAFDTLGNPAITYWHEINNTDKTLKYAHHDGTSWVITNVEPPGSGEGYYNSFAFDASGNPAISYRGGNGSDPRLKYAHYNGTSWDITTFPWAVSFITGLPTISLVFGTSLAFDLLDNPAIAYIIYYAGYDLLNYLDSRKFSAAW